MGIFQYDSGFMKIMDKISKIIIVNILFLFTCLPVFTIGIGLEAMYGTLMKWILEKDDRVFHNYIQEIRKGWLKATAGWMLLLVIAVILFGEFQVIGKMPVPWNFVAGCIAGFTAVCAAVTGLYYFPVAARVKDSVWKLVIISFAGGMRCLLHTVLLVLIALLELFAFTFSIRLLPIWIICGFAAVGWIQAHVYLWVFEKIDICRREILESE